MIKSIETGYMNDNIVWRKSGMAMSYVHHPSVIRISFYCTYAVCLSDWLSVYMYWVFWLICVYVMLLVWCIIQQTKRNLASWSSISNFYIDIMVRIMLYITFLTCADFLKRRLPNQSWQNAQGNRVMVRTLMYTSVLSAS